MVTIEKIRKRIVRAIAKSGKTQIKLARLLGVSQS